MKISKLLGIVSIGLSSLYLSTTVQAAPILLTDFESVTANQFGSLIVVDEFDFNFIDGGAWVIGPNTGIFGNTNGTANLLVNNANPPVEMTRTDGGSFLLNQLDAASVF